MKVLPKKEYDKAKFYLKLGDSMSKVSRTQKLSYTTVMKIEKSTCYLNYLGLALSPNSLKNALENPNYAAKLERAIKSGNKPVEKEKTEVSEEPKSGVKMLFDKIFAK